MPNAIIMNIWHLSQTFGSVVCTYVLHFFYRIDMDTLAPKMRCVRGTYSIILYVQNKLRTHRVAVTVTVVRLL